MHVTWCSSLLSPPLFKGGIVIASARLSIRSFVRLSVCYALSSLTIGRNPTKFGVRNFHMSGLCDSTLLGPSPWGPGEVQRSTIIFEKSISKIFILNFMFVIKNKRMRFSLCRLGRTPAVGLGVAWGQFFFANMVVWHIKLKGMMSRTGYKLNFHRTVKLVIARYSQ